MLESLDVRDFARFGRVGIQFPQSGFCALTGETGVGKSLLIGALAAAIGGRLSERSIRAGASSAEISAIFGLSPEQAGLLGERGWRIDGGQLLLRRVIERGRRVRSYINDSACTATQIGQASEDLIAVFGQHEQMLLHSAGRRREMLDRFAGCQRQAEKVAECWRVWHQADRRLAAVREGQAATAAERGRLERIVREFDDSGQNREDHASYSRMLAAGDNAAELSELAAQLVSELAGADAGCRRASQAIERIREIDGVAAAGAEELVAEARTLVAEALRSAERMQEEDRSHDPAALAEADGYVSETHRLMRHHHCVSPETLFDYLDEVRSRLEALAGDSAAAAERDEGRLRQLWQDAAAGLGKQRRQAAGRLEKRVTALMRKLGMDGGRFEVGLRPHEDGLPRPEGGEQVDFSFAARSREQLRRIEDAASGGELSRLALALYSLCGGGSGQALVFDEVDAGVGGRIAAALGALLAEMGRQRLVLAVTHLPQVAAAADCHWRIDVDAGGASQATQLDDAARAEEIARMLAGRKVTEASRRNAREIIESARAV